MNSKGQGHLQLEQEKTAICPRGTYIAVAPILETLNSTLGICMSALYEDSISDFWEWKTTEVYLRLRLTVLQMN